jgi:hypothetical protein
VAQGRVAGVDGLSSAQGKRHSAMTFNLPRRGFTVSLAVLWLLGACIIEGVSGTKIWPPFAAIIATLLRRFQRRPAACNPNPATAALSKASFPSREEKREVFAESLLEAFLSVPPPRDNSSNPLGIGTEAVRRSSSKPTFDGRKTDPQLVDKTPMTVQEFASLLHSAAMISESKRLAREVIDRARRDGSAQAREAIDRAVR